MALDEVVTDLRTQIDRLLVSAQLLLEHVSDLNAQVQFAVDYMDDNDLLDDHCFTFPDGTTIQANQSVTSHSVFDNND